MVRHFEITKSHRSSQSLKLVSLNHTKSIMDFTISALGYKNILFTILIICVLLCKPIQVLSNNKTDKHDRYIFFLHNRFLEDFSIEEAHPEYGKVEYNKILDSFRNDSFIVFSEMRSKNTDVIQYARFIVQKIDSLLKKGVEADRITVIGTSKGGYIAQYVSTYLANPNMNFVFIGCYQDKDLNDYPEIQFCGNILTIYDVSDYYGVSAIKKKNASKQPVRHFKEIQLQTNMKHGFLYKALELWLQPCKLWAKGHYDF